MSKQLTLFDIDTKHRNNNMTWLELYNFLHNKANNIYHPDTKLWSSKVTVHDAETGDEFACDTFNITDNGGEEKLVLMINLDQM